MKEIEEITKEEKVQAIMQADVLPEQADSAMQPAFASNNVALLFAASENYVPYFSTTLQSLLENSNRAYNYDIIVFHRNITLQSQKIIEKQCAEFGNVCVRFYDVGKAMQPFYADLHIVAYYTIETYYRLLAPYILKNYDKILYLDSDLIVQDDVAKLFFTELSNHDLLAACNDIEWIAESTLYKSRRKYVQTTLKLQNIEHYFQAGVILFNLQAFRESFTSEYIMQFASSAKWELLDQDILNVLAENRVVYFDSIWNIPVEWSMKRRSRNIAKYAPKQLKERYFEVRENPSIIHYAGGIKVWHNTNTVHAEKWWQYAMHTPFYSTIQQGLLDFQKEHKKFKNRAKRAIKKIFMPFVNLFFPKGSHRREKLRKMVIEKKTT